MQCGYRETLVSTRDLATKQGQGNILFHDQLTDTQHDLCTSDAHYFRIGSFRRRRVKFPNRRIGLHSLFNSAMCPWLTITWVHKFIIPTAMRNEKTVVTNFTKCVIVAFWRHNVWPFRGIWVSKQVHVSAVDSKLEVRFRLFVFRSASPSLILKIRRHLVISHASIIDNIVNTGYGA